MAVSPTPSHKTTVSIVSSNDNTPNQTEYVADENLDSSQSDGNIEQNGGSMNAEMVNNLS